MRDKILGGVLGLCVGDALGVPVEFESRESLRSNPVTDMRGYGTYNQPAGTWSDDTSMTICLMDSLSGGLDYFDIMTKFKSWINGAECTAHGEVFDVGNTTRKAIDRFTNGMDALKCGGGSEKDNGNGSLMRILPLVFYLKSLYGDIEEISLFKLSLFIHKNSSIVCIMDIFGCSNLYNAKHTDSGISV